LGGEVLLAAAAGLRQINGDANVKHSRSAIADARGSRERASGRQTAVAGSRRSRARRSCGTANRARQDQARKSQAANEVGGRGGLDPTRYGDWEVNGLASDF